MGEDNSQKVSIYTDNIEEWKIWAWSGYEHLSMVINNSFILSLCTSNLASLHSLHQPALRYILIYIVLCNKKPITWARGSKWGQSAASTGRLTGLHCQWWLSGSPSASLGGQPWRSALMLNSRKYGNNSSTAQEWSFSYFCFRQHSWPFQFVFITSGISLLPVLGNSVKI